MRNSWHSKEEEENYGEERGKREEVRHHKYEKEKRMEAAMDGSFLLPLPSTFSSLLPSYDPGTGVQSRGGKENPSALPAASAHYSSRPGSSSSLFQTAPAAAATFQSPSPPAGRASLPSPNKRGGKEEEGRLTNDCCDDPERPEKQSHRDGGRRAIPLGIQAQSGVVAVSSFLILSFALFFRSMQKPSGGSLCNCHQGEQNLATERKTPKRLSQWGAKRRKMETLGLFSHPPTHLRRELKMLL